MKFIKQAIDYEANRQVAILEDQREVIQETRLYDPDLGKTKSMRSKEEAHDYRYFPCPDLPPLIIEKEWVDKLRESLPELPDKKKARFVKEFKITDYDATVLTLEKNTADFFEEVADKSTGKLAANWVINELFGRLKKEDLSIEKSPISAQYLKEIITYINTGDISSKIAKQLFDLVWEKQNSPSKLIEQFGLRQVTDKASIEAIVQKIISQNPEQVTKAKLNPKLVGWFVGQVMKETHGKANPNVANQIVTEKLQIL